METSREEDEEVDQDEVFNLLHRKFVGLEPAQELVQIINRGALADHKRDKRHDQPGPPHTI
jgi:hypothetical protein